MTSLTHSIQLVYDLYSFQARRNRQNRLRGRQRLYDKLLQIVRMKRASFNTDDVYSISVFVLISGSYLKMLYEESKKMNLSMFSPEIKVYKQISGISFHPNQSQFVLLGRRTF